MKAIHNKFEQAKGFYEKNEKAVEAAVFLGGFFFDIFTLGRPDDLFNILQQLLYITLLYLLFHFEVQFDVLLKPVPEKLVKAWKYRKLAQHFLLGSLLSVYTLFFFKSGSILSSALFLFIIIALMILNELPFVQNLGAFVRAILLTLCTGSFFAITIPILFGFVGRIPFLLAMILGGGLTFLLYKKLYLNLNKKLFLIPSAGTYVFFTIFYLLGLVPPVPLSLEYIGIYHKVEKSNNNYILSYTRPDWKFWQHGDQTFIAKHGDRIHCFVKIFSPASFKDQVSIDWLYDDPKQGWIKWDSIPLPISGGREDGYRGFAVKSNYQEGKWQVRVRTSDGSEIGRISFTVEPAEPSPERPFEVDVL